MRPTRLAPSSTVLRSAVLLLLTLAAHAAAQTTEVNTSSWGMLAPEGEEFKVLMPKPPNHETGKEPYHRMTLNTHLYTVSGNDGSLFAVVTLSGIKSVTAAWTETERFNSYVDAFGKWFPKKVWGKEVASHMTFQGGLQLNGHAGREYRLTVGDTSGPARFYITRKKFYAVVALNTKKDEARVDRFMSSFSLLEKRAEPGISQAAEAPQAGAAGTPDVDPAGGSELKINETASDTTMQPGQRAPVSGGVLNGKATSLPKPEYSPEAREAKASGTVTVRVTVDEEGNVTEAHAVAGPALLREAAEAAARQAKFAPTRLQGQAVKVTGVLTYNFVLQE